MILRIHTGVVLALIILGSATRARAQSDVTSEARMWEQTFETAVIARDRARLETILADEFLLRGSPDIDRDQWLGTTSALCWGDRVEIAHLRAQRVDGIVPVTFELTFYVDPETCRPSVVRTLVTDLWVQSGATWRLYLRHSAPAPDSTRGIAAHYGLVPQPPPAWDFSVELSWAGTSGNTSVQTLGTGANLVHHDEQATTEVMTSFLTSRSEGVLDARVVTARARHAIRQSRHVEWFGQMGYTRDEFAGIEHRAAPDGGIAITAQSPSRYKASVEAAVGYTVESRLATADLQFAAARVAGRAAWTGWPATELRQDVELIDDFADARNWRGTSTTVFSMTMTRIISMKLSQALDYRHAPVPGFRPLDLRSTATLIVSMQRR